MKRIVDKNINICESGGLLLGFVRETHFEVREVTIPYKKDYASHNFFVRNDEKHLDIFRYLKLNKKYTYIGEWHTHPEDNPKPSCVDIKEWNIIKSKCTYPIVFLILGRKNFYITIK